MPTRTIGIHMGPTASDTRSDTELVTVALNGDRAAFAAVYDRYAPTVYSVCSQMLSSRDDAEDVTADVFLVAAERLGQLRDPSRLRYWLLSIARRHVYRRSSARSRVAVVAEVDTVSDALVTEDRAGDALEGADLVAAVQDASAGLDEGDRMVLELTLQGCEGADLAEVLGVSANTASQAASRMRSRLERAIGALFVARQGQSDCDDLREVLSGWDGTFSVLWRKRVARHVDRCTTCERRAKRVPAVLLQGVAGAAPAVVVPIGIRHRVVSGARVGESVEPPWSDSGFPPADVGGGAWRRVAMFAGGLAVVVAALFLAVGAGRGDGVDPVVTSVPESSTSSSSVVPTTQPPTTQPPTTQPPTTAPPPTSPPGSTRPGGSGTASDDGTTAPPTGGSDTGGTDTGGTDTAPTTTTPPVRPTRPTEPPPSGVTEPPPTTRPGGMVRPPRSATTLPPLLDPGSGGPILR